MLNHAISRWDKTITAELWPCSIQHAATIYNTTKRRSQDYNLSPWEQFTGECSRLDQTDMHPLFCPVYVLDRRMQEGTSPPKWTKRITQKVFKIGPHGMGSKDETSITTISRYVRQQLQHCPSTRSEHQTIRHHGSFIPNKQISIR
jgi:hypothetical protein